MNLPSSLKLLRARISLLRITVPADLYKSGILVEVQGVEILLKTRAAAKEESGNRRPNVLAKRDGEHPISVKVDGPRSTQPLIHDPGGLRSSQTSNSGEETDNLLPTTADLAQSFLQTEPQSEKEGLEAALAQSQAYNLEESSVTSEPDDEISAYGIGNALSLPTFLADFLKGVGDRVQVQIEDVTIDLEIGLDLPLGSSTDSTTSEKTDIVTVRLSIENVDLEGAAPSRPNANQDRNQPGYETDARETRRIIFKNMHGTLVSDALLFANLSRFDVPSSPIATQASSVAQSSSNKLASFSNLASSTSTTSQKILGSFVIQDNHPSIPTSSTLEASTLTSDSERFADAENENQTAEALAPLYARNLEGSRYQDSVIADSFYSNDTNQIIGPINMNSSTNLSQNIKATLQEPSHHSSSETYNEQTRLYTVGSKDPEMAEALNSSIYSSLTGSNRLDQDVLDDIRDGNSAGREMTGDGFEQSQSIMSAVGEDIGFESPLSEDLTQSKIFSHEEAESMYMSAISHVSSDEEKSPRASGGWKSFRWDSKDPSDSTISPAEDQKTSGENTFPYLRMNSSSSLDHRAMEPVFR